jgi:hypothetical protein
MLKNLLNLTATIMEEQESTDDVYGNPSKVFVTVADFRARIEPSESLEEEINRDTLITYWTLFLEETAHNVIQGTSIVAVSGPGIDDELYQVLGKPKTFYRRYVPNHIEATVRIIEG